MQLPSFSVLWAFVLGCLATQVKAYPVGQWPMYVQVPREYPEEDYYYTPKIQYYNNAPARQQPEVPVYGRMPYPYYYDTLGQYIDEDPARQDERLASLPVGQETWYENDAEPSSNEMDDVNAAFLENLILTHMAQDAQRRRENAKMPPSEYEPRDLEDEDVRELKALAGKPLYHVPKTAPVYEDEDYPADDSFINWNGNKRSVTTAAPPSTTRKPKLGQDEIMVPRPAQPHHNHQNKQFVNNHKDESVFAKIKQILAVENAANNLGDSSGAKRIEKRFVAGDKDLVAELRGLKRRIAT